MPHSCAIFGANFWPNSLTNFWAIFTTSYGIAILQAAELDRGAEHAQPEPLEDAEPPDAAPADVRQLHRGGEQDCGGDDGRRGAGVAGRHARPQGQEVLRHGAVEAAQEEGEQAKAGLLHFEVQRLRLGCVNS